MYYFTNKYNFFYDNAENKIMPLKYKILTEMIHNGVIDNYYWNNDDFFSRIIVYDEFCYFVKDMDIFDSWLPMVSISTTTTTSQFDKIIDFEWTDQWLDKVFLYWRNLNFSYQKSTSSFRCYSIDYVIPVTYNWRFFIGSKLLSIKDQTENNQKIILSKIL